MPPDSAEEPLVQPAPPSESSAPPTPSHGRRGRNMLPERDRRSPPERLLVRLIATCGIVGIGVAISAIMHSSGSQGWMIGLVVSIVSVVLAAVLWSSRVL
jgi:protein-S-isoprenylcysteine O-methyltransferase Ste14